MEYAPGFSSIAALLADAGRAAMIWALMDGSARPAGELALLAGLSPSSTSAHLAKLVEGGLLVQQRHGRNRYYRLAGPEVRVTEVLPQRLARVVDREPRHALAYPLRRRRHHRRRAHRAVRPRARSAHA